MMADIKAEIPMVTPIVNANVDIPQLNMNMDIPQVNMNMDIPQVNMNLNIPVNPVVEMNMNMN